MKIILLEDVRALGKKGDIVNVSDGYANNCVLPKKLGVEASAQNLNMLRQKKKRQEKDEEMAVEEAKKFASEIEEKTITVTMKAGEGQRVFGSVSSKEIATAAMQQYKFEIDKKKIQLAEPIKAFGTYDVPVRLHQKVTCKLHVSVVERK